MSGEIRHIVVLGAQPEWLSGLRGPMLRDFVARGYRVTAIGAEEMPAVRARLEGWGVAYKVVPISRAGLNPLADLASLVALYRKLRKLKPDLLFAYTIKPVVYGMPVGWAAGVKQRYAMITGRGYSFQEGSGLARAMVRVAATLLYAFGLRFANGVLFHNEDDRAMFRQRGMISRRLPTTRIWGSGIDLLQHGPRPLPPLGKNHPVRFLMIGRLVRAKGVAEYAAAASQLKAAGHRAVCRLVGPYDPSPDAVSRTELESWINSGAIEYVGPLDDVRDEITQSHVVVLPSYSEGLPRSVLEGMAAGRAIITTSAPGCIDTVEAGRSGLIVPVKDAQALASAMKRLIEEPELIARFGVRSLELARERFDVDSVNAEIAAFLGLRERQGVVQANPRP